MSIDFGGGTLYAGGKLLGKVTNVKMTVAPPIEALRIAKSFFTVRCDYCYRIIFSSEASGFAPLCDEAREMIARHVADCPHWAKEPAD